MSNEIAVQEHAMVMKARELVAERQRAPEIVAAEEVAATLIRVVVMGEAEARAVEDGLAVIANAGKVGKAMLDEVCALPAAVIKAAREQYAPTADTFKRATDDGKSAVLGYRTRERQRIEKEQREAQAAAVRAADAETKRLRESATPGEPVLTPPPVEVSAPIKPKSTYTPTTTKIAFELYDPSACDPTHLKLDDPTVRAYLMYQETLQGSRFPVGKENATVVRGIRAWREESIAVRGRA